MAGREVGGWGRGGEGVGKGEEGNVNGIRRQGQDSAIPRSSDNKSAINLHKNGERINQGFRGWWEALEWVGGCQQMKKMKETKGRSSSSSSSVEPKEKEEKKKKKKKKKKKEKKENERKDDNNKEKKLDEKDDKRKLETGP